MLRCLLVAMLLLGDSDGPSTAHAVENTHTTHAGGTLHFEGRHGVIGRMRSFAPRRSARQCYRYWQKQSVTAAGCQSRNCDVVADVRRLRSQMVCSQDTTRYARYAWPCAQGVTNRGLHLASWTLGEGLFGCTVLDGEAPAGTALLSHTIARQGRFGDCGTR